ncbi:IclR family transcriptional regulator C-terminal domain-containing protein [Xylophilus sp. GOD-11R]|uniref:IclR family transcriptional regulator domain-containing protein n=1 Tax=Xylophilus sp. GOD-11R TaxID=3089814 RepID=UPI00298D0BC1|nr:IclR family transcriptional regulator C-terminal domain-containing protein [Xylophilus sp. GOD-11R]WPB55863.1 IclR family transcriptional regulator C-terminal domain-containing protein [Xylophilus sp. GOD-11R]
MKTPPLRQTDWIAGLEYGLQVIESFNRDHDRMTISDVSRRTGLSRSAARRYLLTLVHLGYMAFDGKLFSLSPRILRVGWAYFDSVRLPRMLQPHLLQLSNQVGHACYISVLDDWHLVIIGRGDGARATSAGYVLGARIPAVLTSAGIMLLALQKSRDEVVRWLAETTLASHTAHTITDADTLLRCIDDARNLGYAVMEQQLQLDVRGIAVPLRRWDGGVIAAINVNSSMNVEHLDTALQRTLPAMKACANRAIELL